jgi:hypothetical protein
MELVVEVFKSGGDNWLSQNIYKLIIFIGNEENLKRFICYTIMDKMEIDFHVLCACMKNRVNREIRSTYIITPQLWWRVEMNTKVTT